MAANESSNTSFRLGAEIPHCRSLWIGILEDTWEEIGMQYGQRCGKDIARNFDINWEKRILQGEASVWQQGRTEQQRAQYAIAYVQRSFEELSYLRREI